MTFRGPASALLASLLLGGALAGPAVAAAPIPVALADEMAPGHVSSELGLSLTEVSVPAGGEVTFVATTTPALRAQPVEIWTSTAGSGWHRAAIVMTVPDGTARYFTTISVRTRIQARLAATSTHAAAVGAARAVRVDAGGRNGLSVTCGDAASWGRGTIAARAAGTSVGGIVSVSVCHSSAVWSAIDVDASATVVTHFPVSAGSTLESFEFSPRRPGSRTVRLVWRAPGTPASAERTLLVLLEMAPVTVRTVATVALTPVIACGATRCQVRADVIAPAAPGPWPVVVLLRGGPGGLGTRQAYAAFATRLAAEGVVVFNADYRDTPDVGARFPLAFADAACAVRVARSTAGRYGGDPDGVTLVGHSLGAYVGAVVSLSANAFASACLASGAGAPDSFVGISGPYQLDQPNLQSDFASVLGGSKAQRPYAWTNGDPFNWVGRRPGVRFRLIQGDADPEVDPAGAIALQAALRAAQLDAFLTTVSGGTHVSVINDAKTGDWARAAILEAVR